VKSCRCDEHWYRFNAVQKQVVVQGRNAQLHLPRLLSTALSSFLLDGRLLGNDLSNFNLDLVDLSFARKIGLQVLDDLLDGIFVLIIDDMRDVDVVGVWATGTESIFAFLNGSLLQQGAEVFKLAGAQLEASLQFLHNCSSGLRDLLGLDEGQSSEAHIGEAQN
jgi:hypothetical protein